MWIYTNSSDGSEGAFFLNKDYKLLVEKEGDTWTTGVIASPSTTLVLVEDEDKDVCHELFVLVLEALNSNVGIFNLPKNIEEAKGIVSQRRKEK